MLMQKKIKLCDIVDITDPFIFSKMHQLMPTLEWLNDDNISSLDMEYLSLHSGEKYISPAVRKLIDLEESGEIESWIDEISKMILNGNADNWNRIYNVYVLSDYNPLENYDMEENENVGSSVHTDITNNSGTYGFNSVGSVPKDKIVSASNTSGNFDDNKRKLTRHGNIGVTTSQQMLQSELDLRKINFYQLLMNIIDNYMCLKKY